MSDLIIGIGKAASAPDVGKTEPVKEKRRSDATFADLLQNKIQKINSLQVEADQAISKVALEDSGSVHEAVIALEKASISFSTMMEVRNKIVEAYQEIMRMQV